MTSLYKLAVVVLACGVVSCNALATVAATQEGSEVEAAKAPSDPMNTAHAPVPPKSTMPMPHKPNMPMPMMMQMYFFADIDSGYYILFESCKIDTKAKFAVAFILCFLFGAFSTFLSVETKKIEAKVERGELTGKTWLMASGLLNALRSGFHYLAMLIAMTYNVGIFISVVLGHGVGYILAQLWTVRCNSHKPLEEVNREYQPVAHSVSSCDCM
mmetsp:Transcript_376/g.386  ORF Transcript_376/g.386 Transcript_376/m.386 type:complete len:214 (-) Transcript_376:873-1514(-)|eukprot:CAMPEP_0197848398 /NCGR_PEP_ID=MMETSP1438-20131217/8620_1 /TAXON_ID=1461541 /ORGANISM="Pterosperma sp., Strain CCMP1384" /LENGTH=213 /DNA_ID=CAMNT_0043460619 /DNA_START=321 /DNA_END=962 /DNA_ORIENTATION=+